MGCKIMAEIFLNSLIVVFVTSIIFGSETLSQPDDHIIATDGFSGVLAVPGLNELNL